MIRDGSPLAFTDSSGCIMGREARIRNLMGDLSSTKPSLIQNKRPNTDSAQQETDYSIVGTVLVPYSRNALDALNGGLERRGRSEPVVEGALETREQHCILLQRRVLTCLEV